jgi:hypothetical protein
MIIVFCVHSCTEDGKITPIYLFNNDKFRVVKKTPSKNGGNDGTLSKFTC